MDNTIAHKLVTLFTSLSICKAMLSRLWGTSRILATCNLLCTEGWLTLEATTTESSQTGTSGERAFALIL
jgi:hypothetical protein